MLALLARNVRILLERAIYLSRRGSAAPRGKSRLLGRGGRNILFLAVLGISMLWGQAFCGFLCPFGALQEFLSVKALRATCVFFPWSGQVGM